MSNIGGLAKHFAYYILGYGIAGACASSINQMIHYHHLIETLPGSGIPKTVGSFFEWCVAGLFIGFIRLEVLRRRKANSEALSKNDPKAEIESVKDPDK